MIPVRRLFAAGPRGGEGRVSRSLWTHSRPRGGRSQAWRRARRPSRVSGRSGAGGILDPAPLPRPTRAHECIGSGAGGWDPAHPSVCRTDVHMSRAGGSARSRLNEPPRCAAAATVRPARLGVHLWVDGWARHAHAGINLSGARWATRTPNPHAYGVHLRVAGWAWRVLAPRDCPALSLRRISAAT
jgi:hypothetical protein